MITTLINKVSSSPSLVEVFLFVEVKSLGLPASLTHGEAIEGFVTSTGSTDPCITASPPRRDARRGWLWHALARQGVQG